MEQSAQVDRHNRQRQLAIQEVAAQAEGKGNLEVVAMLEDAFARRGLPRQPPSWTAAVAAAASSGTAYIINDVALTEEPPEPPKRVLRPARSVAAAGTAAPGRSFPSRSRLGSLADPRLLAVAVSMLALAFASARLVLRLLARTDGRTNARRRRG